ncbi:MAG: dihydrodipicolinate synthase family protein [Pirellulaceae bacterium]|nr:dihydrodipicolinate synthase family protein [Pirellulaceae bacterium]
MDKAPITSERLAASVIAVPPLARSADFTLNFPENRRIVQHLEAGGVTTLLYGGNAVLYHVSLSEYAALLLMLTEIAGDWTLVIPSVGPAFGLMMDQAEVLNEFAFPTAMVLPQSEIATSDGIAAGVRRFTERYGKPVVLYIKHDRYIAVDTVRRLVDDGLISWIKYAVVRGNPEKDDYLRELTEAVDPARIVSGIGEQPAVVHLRDFSLGGFTSGCVCIAPRLSMDFLHAVRAGDISRAEEIRAVFRPLEDLRNRIHPIRVLHAAVALAGIAETGPMVPLLSPIDSSDEPEIANTARTLLQHNGAIES